MSELSVPSDLRLRFSRFGQAEQVLGRLGDTIDRIHDLNLAGAGDTSDEIAQVYRSKVDGPTANLKTLVGTVRDVLLMTDENGQQAGDTFEQGESDAGGLGRRW
ncbi:hypothetical protein [Micromonospora sp. NBC_01813]|uniref:hypothetical protein n=1 Tax=Micromonospora sp. NBC_01813 TaxID=2975988 RepID=UPI002DDB57A2|nr:hypothetical protein [Micromonospora sp. NBC_01813]WSA10333.1 hypothetical protein OG958_05935 [Micromonospora sp. NBC_01813]